MNFESDSIYLKPSAMVRYLPLGICLVSMFLFAGSPLAQTRKDDLRSRVLKVTFGQTGKIRVSKQVTFKGSAPDLLIANVQGRSTEVNDSIGQESTLIFGAGDADELILHLTWRKPVAELRAVYDRAKMWQYLLEHGASGQVERLLQDPWNQPDAPLLTLQLNSEATEGFTFSLEQLLQQGAMWLPDLDIFLTWAEKPVSFRKHLASLTGERVLERVKKEPDASLEQFRKRWTDFGNPLTYDEPWQTKYMGTTGHLVLTAAAHGSVYKFAVDRWGSVRPDFASPYKFRMDLVWTGSNWTGQRIEDGLPVITTSLVRNQQGCEMEQFASPLGNLDAAIRGYIPSVFFTRISFSGAPGPVDLVVHFSNELSDVQMEWKESDGAWTVFEKESGKILLMLEPESGWSVQVSKGTSDRIEGGLTLHVDGALGTGEIRRLIVKMPSPSVPPSMATHFKVLDYSAAKSNVVAYWEEWIAKGAHFDVPEKAVNDLIRANLWHALILPRHTYGANGRPHMDLPYANTAYGQTNSDWPVNQAVYVDYMIYGLRGYEDVAEEELAAMFVSQQQSDGRIAGFANWGVYSPAHLYAIAQNYLLSGDRERFERLLPMALKTLDWCLTQVRGSATSDNNPGLILGPLNDLSVGERGWAFTQAYYVGGLELFGKALSNVNHPRAKEVLRTSSAMKAAVAREFARSSVRSPVVQLADGSWTNYVPTDVTTPRRMLDQWYPTDVDTGPLHLTRLGVLDPNGWLTSAMLNDHEDNLFLDNNGAANEPVYVQQANAYLLRDEPKAVIRSFYSFMACGFSREQYSPLEHRWAHPQYYGPPSTDGAWFEIFRKMLINEVGDDTLIVGQAIPRAWLRERKQVQVKDAPTYFGDVSFSIEAKSSVEIAATIELESRRKMNALLVRFRHPNGKRIKSVLVNGKAWHAFDVVKEQIIIPQPGEERYLISVRY